MLVLREAGHPNTDIEYLKRSEDGLPTSGVGRFSFGTMGIFHRHGQRTTTAPRIVNVERIK